MDTFKKTVSVNTKTGGNLGLELDEQGNVKADGMQQTNIKGLFAAGDVHGSMGALAAAYDGGMAAISIVHGWYD